MTSSKSKRLDQLLIDKGIFKSRHQAQLAILAGNVIINNTVVDKAGKLVPKDAKIELKEKPKFVSRGGLKLAEALDKFNIKVKDKVAIDIGSSTGGFTDCLLQNGAKSVYAVDVGYGQLVLQLRNDPRVTLMEKTNARYLKPDNFKIQPSFVTIDVSFISLDKILPAVSGLLSKGSEVIALIKPQFEAGPKHLKKGVVRDDSIHETVIDKIKESAVKNGFSCKDVIPSPILGPKGNKEFLLYMKRI